jgi:DNA-binding NarL/FixJ family response regulator
MRARRRCTQLQVNRLRISKRRPPEAASPTLLEASYWKQRLVRRKYTAHARPGSENEFFARIDWEGCWAYFPLGSQSVVHAAERAREIYLVTANDGWGAACRRYEREITLAVLWLAEPLACTYATLFTTIAGAPLRQGSACDRTSGAVRVAIVEPDAEVRRALELWINQIPGYTCMRTIAEAGLLLKQNRPERPDLVLFNQHLLGATPGEWLQRLRSHKPGLPALPFMICRTSGDVFANMTGVDHGYFLRRRPPNQMLEPIAGLFEAGQLTVAQMCAQFRTYFQGLISSDLGDTASNSLPLLTQREAEILRCLGEGHTDKSIAQAIGISVWTVHDHIKNIFRKLGVHTRAEAVTHYLQK